MPQKALVAFGVVFSLLILSAPVLSSERNEAERAGNVPSATAPSIKAKSKENPVSTLPVLTIDEARTRTLRQNPKLSAFSREVKARKFDALQAGVRPNPELSVEMENFAGNGEFSGTENAETTIRISQRLELGGKRERRQDVARQKGEMAEREFEVVRTEVLAEVAGRFIKVLTAQEKVGLAAEQLELTQKVMQTVEDRVAAGKTAHIEKVRSRSLVAEARLRQKRARQELTTARRALALLWGSDELAFSAVQGSFRETRKVPEWSELLSRLPESPEVDLQKSAQRRAERVLELQGANRFPDLTVSLGVKDDRGSGSNALVAEIAMPLPVFDRNKGAIAAAKARLAKGEDETRAARLRLQADMAEAWRTLKGAYSEVEILREEILPASRRSFEGIAYGYQAGKFGFLDVLDAERQLFEAKTRYVEALSRYHQAVAETERLLGQKLFTRDGGLEPVDRQRGQS